MPDEFRWRSKLLRLGYQACDALVAPSVAFAEAMQALLDDEVSCHRLGSAARHRARRYTVETMAAAMTDLYRSLSPARGLERLSS